MKNKHRNVDKSCNNCYHQGISVTVACKKCVLFSKWKEKKSRVIEIGSICIVEDFQGFGETKVILAEKYYNNLKGAPLKEPIWGVHLMSAKDKAFNDFIQERKPLFDLVSESSLRRDFKLC